MPVWLRDYLDGQAGTSQPDATRTDRAKTEIYSRSIRIYT